MQLCLCVSYTMNGISDAIQDVDLSYILCLNHAMCKVLEET